MTIKPVCLVLGIAPVATCAVAGDDEWREIHRDRPGGYLEGDLCEGLPVDVFSEGFSRGNNGAWSLSPQDVIDLEGGHPGQFLHAAHLDTFAPVARTQWQRSSMFTGNYRARRAVALGSDFKTFSVGLSADARPLSLMLVSDADTPKDTSDDIAVYYVGPDNVPLPGDGWVRGRSRRYRGAKRQLTTSPCRAMAGSVTSSQFRHRAPSCHILAPRSQGSRAGSLLERISSRRSRIPTQSGTP